MHANHPFYRTSYSGCSVSVKVGGIVVVALLVGIVVVITKVAKKAKTSKKEDASRNNLLYN